jgi:hypothetical protein
LQSKKEEECDDDACQCRNVCPYLLIPKSIS